MIKEAVTPLKKLRQGFSNPFQSFFSIVITLDVIKSLDQFFAEHLYKIALPDIRIEGKEISGMCKLNHSIGKHLLKEHQIRFHLFSLSPTQC